MKSPPPHVATDPDAPASEDELRRAAELRDALSNPTRANDDAVLARALVLSHSPRPLGEGENRALVQRALSAPTAVVMPFSSARARRARNRWIAAGVGALALAAATLPFLGPNRELVATVTSPISALRIARSTQPLFHEPFAARGQASARIDRIVSSRTADLRENMFARWAVQ